MKIGRHLPKMSGRDIAEENRVSTPLELLFDLTFAISLSAVGLQLSHLLSRGEIVSGLLAFIISMLSICWAWMSYAWFASAYDTDDWAFRVATMIHMVGVVVLTLGLPRLFRSIEQGGPLDNSIMVLGYVIMRFVMIALWLRAAKHDLLRRRALVANAAVVFIAQILWIFLVFLKLPMLPGLLALSALGCFEFSGPIIFYRKWGPPPWHAYHIAERYSCLTIIALGECVAGAVAMTNATVEVHGWSFEPILIGTACVGLAFGCWWIYYLNPFGEFLESRRERSFGWGFLHILIFSSIVAMGAGLQAAGVFLEGKSQLSLGVFISSVFVVTYPSLTNQKRFFILLWCGSLLVLVGAFAMAKINMSFPVCLCVITTAPFVVIIGREVNRFNENRKSV